MNTWLVIVIFGQVVASSGPTTIETCRQASHLVSEELDANYRPAPFNGRIVERRDVYPACFMQANRPNIGEIVETN